METTKPLASTFGNKILKHIKIPQETCLKQQTWKEDSSAWWWRRRLHKGRKKKMVVDDDEEGEEEEEEEGEVFTREGRRWWALKKKSWQGRIDGGWWRRQEHVRRRIESHWGGGHWLLFGTLCVDEEFGDWSGGRTRSVSSMETLATSVRDESE